MTTLSDPNVQSIYCIIFGYRSSRPQFHVNVFLATIIDKVVNRVKTDTEIV